MRRNGDAVPRAKICFVLPSLAGGGAERAAVQILNALDDRIWDRAMYLFAREGPYLAELSPEIALVAGTGQTRSARWRQLRGFVRQTRPDIVVAFLSYFTVLTAVRSAAVGTRVVFNQQTPMSAFLTDADYAWRSGWRRHAFVAATRAGYRAADLVVATSQGVAHDLESSFSVPARRIRVLPNPVNLEQVRAASREPIPAIHHAAWRAPVLVAAGRLAEAKNYPLLIEALAVLRQRVAARLFILGQGEMEGALRELIAARQLTDEVTLCGFQSNPWSYIARADVFALTSRYEGFGNVLVEAMACGVPVVATASPGTRDIVTHGVDGMLVEQHTAAAVADALEHLLAEPHRRAEMAAAARRSSARFALPMVADAYDAALREVAA